MEILSLILFFVYTFGLGYGITKLLKLSSADFFEINIMRVGIGTALLILLGALFNLLHIPLDWRIFLVISALPFLLLLKGFRLPRVRLTKSSLYFFSSFLFRYFC